MNEITRIHPRKLKKVLCCALGLMGVVSGGDAQCYDARPDPVVATYNLDAHFNHYHLNIRPPTKKPEVIEPSKKLMAAQEGESPIMLAAAPSPTATNSGVSTSADAQITKYEKVISGCTYAVSANWSPVAMKMYNDIDPVSGVIMYLAEHGLSVKGITAPSGIDPNQFKLKVLQYPAHGKFLPSSYTYHANQGYLGVDRVSFEVDVLDKKFKVVWTLVVQDSNPDGPTPDAVKAIDKACPSSKGSFLNIIELPSEGFASNDELANLHSMVNFALGGGFMGNGGSLNIADLAGAAVGQTTGTSITLDTNAAGNGWFIDATPADNSEFLPTSNPNEWIAKAGTAAAGKMDMLSVLLHEYGHALGIEHSSNPNDFMATTLTAGVRRLPSAAEMALMQQLIAQAKTGVIAPQTGSNAATDQPNNTPLPIIPLGGFGIAFAGLLQRNRYGGLSIAVDPSSVVTQYAIAANATLTNGSLNAADGWSTQGSVDIAFGAATLNEVATSQTRLS